MEQLNLNFFFLFDGSKFGLNIQRFRVAGWADCRLDYKSVSIYVTIVAGAAVSWKSNKRSNVATLSAVAEYAAIGGAAQESTWFGRIILFAKGNRSKVQSQ